MDPEIIKNLALFSGLELFLIVGVIFAIFLIIKLGPPWLDKRYKLRLAELNNETRQLEVETNAMVKEVASRLDRLEELSDCERGNIEDLRNEYTSHLIKMEERHENQLLSIEKLFDKDKVDRTKRQKELDSWKEETNAKLLAVNESIQQVFSMIADNEELTKDASRGTLENMLTSETSSPLRRLKAFRRLLAMGVNGIVKKVGMRVILEHKDLWLEVLAMDLDLEILDEDYYDRVMDEIRRNIFGGVM